MHLFLSVFWSSSPISILLPPQGFLLTPILFAFFGYLLQLIHWHFPSLTLPPSFPLFSTCLPFLNSLSLLQIFLLFSVIILPCYSIPSPCNKLYFSHFLTFLPCLLICNYFSSSSSWSYLKYCFSVWLEIFYSFKKPKWKKVIFNRYRLLFLSFSNSIFILYYSLFMQTLTKVMRFINNDVI